MNSQEAQQAEAIADRCVPGRPVTGPGLGRALANYSAAEAYHQDFFERNPYQGYCLAVAAPKVAKFRQTFARLVRG